MRDRLIEIVDKSKEEYANDVTDHTETEYIAKYLLENGVIVPPCKVGDTVYELVNWCDYTNCRFEGCAGCGNCNDRGVLERKFNLSHLAQIGKTVFLTRAEAEQALKGGAE